MPHFFATENDIIPVLRGVEKSLPVKYVPSGVSSSPDPQVFARGEDIPNLGIAAGASAILCSSFLICESALNLRARSIDGGRTFTMDQLENPDTVAYLTGGQWKDILLYGRFATCTAPNSTQSKRLLQRYTYQLKKRFKYIGGYYVGPEAEQMLRQGKRLTIAEQSPENFDLKLTN